MYYVDILAGLECIEHRNNRNTIIFTTYIIFIRLFGWLIVFVPGIPPNNEFVPTFSFVLVLRKSNDPHKVQ